MHGRNSFGGRSRQRPALIDAGGARRRQQEQDRLWAQQEREREAFRGRLAKAAGKIPVLKTVEQIEEYAGYINGGIFDSGRKLQFPALQVSGKLDIDQIFAALPQGYGSSKPNVMAERHGETGVGAHFDNYGGTFMPWTLHENLAGRGTIRATLMSKSVYDGYRALADSLPDNDATQELLAHNRAALGELALSGGSFIYKGPIEPGTRTLIWHGTDGHPPAAHEVLRDEPGSYRVYADQRQGDLGEGFVTI